MSRQELEMVILEHTRTALKIATLMSESFIAETDEEAEKMNKEIDVLKTKLNYLREKRIEFLGR